MLHGPALGVGARTWAPVHPGGSRAMHAKRFGRNLLVPRVSSEDFSLWGMWLHGVFF